MGGGVQRHSELLGQLVPLWREKSPWGPLMWNLWVFLDDAQGCQCPFFCTFIHRVVFKEVSGHRVLLKSESVLWDSREVKEAE